MSELNTLEPSSFGELLERLLVLTRRVGLRLLGVTVIVMVPAAVLVGLTLHSSIVLFADVAEQIAAAGDLAPLTLERLSKALGYLGLTALVLLVAEVVIFVAGQLFSCAELLGRRIGFSEAVQLTLGTRLFKALVQRILAEVVIVSLVLLPYGLVLSAVTQGGAVLLSLGLAVVAVVLALVLRVRWAFAGTAIVWEDAPIGLSFVRSTQLVRGYGWRTFWLFAMFFVLASILSSIVTIPVQMLTVWPSMADLLQVDPDAADPSAVFRVLSDLGVAYGAAAAASQLLIAAARSLYVPLVYMDLRVRGGEFTSEAA
jgi:hypothetical protein